MSHKSQRLELTWYNKDMALIPTEDGRYGYMWVSPSDPRYCETRTLVMDEYVKGRQSPKEDGRSYSARADLEPSTDNLLVLGESGDVLEALTRVPELAHKYLGKVKLIYIDPPFNTSQTFASYEDNLEHSIWLTMMRDRLLHLKKLLSPDGSIWVHLDDVEVHRMRLLLDEIFGGDKYIAEMHWVKTYSPRNDSTGIPMVTDTILVYSNQTFTANRLPRTSQMNSIYSNRDKDRLGPWTSDNPAAPTTGPIQHPGVYGIQHPVTGEMLYPPSRACWRVGQESLLKIMKEWGNYDYGEVTETELDKRREVCGPGVQLRTDIRPLVIPDWNEDDTKLALKRYEKGNWPVYFFTRNGQGGLRRKSYLSHVAKRTPVNLLPYEEVGHTDGAKKEIRQLFPDYTAFSTPKPERLLERIIHIGSNPGDIVLDVFAGSGTTAAVAQKMGRRWVTCELVEDTFNRFTRPRLEKVINDEDPGGITHSPAERIAADGVELPEGMTAEDAQKLTSLLNKVLKVNPELKKSKEIRALKASVKTQKQLETTNWRGGGGFQIAHLGPRCFDYSETLNQVILTPHATGDALIESVVANLGFSLLHPEDDIVFHGKKGRMLLKVHEGIATPELVDNLTAQLENDELLLIAATSIMDGAREHLRKTRKGSRIIHIPDDIFHCCEEERE